jgi:peptidoglycan/LPS O-acetylase OafA/YrhL
MIAAMTLMILIFAVFTVTLVSWVLLDLYEQVVRRPRRTPWRRAVLAHDPLSQD